MERAPVPPVPRAPQIKNLEFKIGLLLALTLILGAVFIGYALYSRGAFQSTHKLWLTASDVENVSVGMPISFSGFPIGKVSRLSLEESGEVRIEVTLPAEDARWLRKNSTFTLEKAIVGGAKIKVSTPNLKDPALENGAVRPLQSGDATKALLDKVDKIVGNVADMTAAGSSINQTLGHVATVTGRMAGDQGVLGGLMGGPENAGKIITAIDRANTLLSSLNGVSLKVDTVLAKTDDRLFAKNGIMDQAQSATGNVNAILLDVRESLKKLDATLAHVQTASADASKITGNVAAATTDLKQLRLEIDDSIRKVNHLINEINKKWPFAREVEIKTP